MEDRANDKGGRSWRVDAVPYLHTLFEELRDSNSGRFKNLLVIAT
jgi:hypothetical protein